MRNKAIVNVEFAVENEMLLSSYTIQDTNDTLNFRALKWVAPRNENGSELYKEDIYACHEGDHFYSLICIA